jgi:predicted nucleic-acid-binding Zn-ribbon protein
MKNGTCPSCGSSEIIADLRIHGGEDHPSYVEVAEPEPANRPFIWMQKNEQSHFKVDVCGSCGYAEFYAENYKALNEARKKGYKST